MMDFYKKNIREIVSKTSFSCDDIFDYEFSPYKDEFNSIFYFYYKALKLHSNYEIEPSLLFFKNDFSINAAAGLENDFFIIYINMGTVVGLIKQFKEKSDLIIDSDNDDFIEFEKTLDKEINELMYQNALHFTFYHELAHLIQKSDFLKDMIFETPVSNNTFSIKRHLLELDADQFSSLCIGTHVVGYVKKLFGRNLTEDKLEKVLIIICSSALFYILSFKTSKAKIYYKENTHPHPIIRITCIVFHIVGYVQQALEQDGFRFKFDIKEIINKCILFSNKISSYKLNNSQIEDYIDISGEEALNITSYLRELRELEIFDNSLASNKWNVMAKTLNNDNYAT